MPKVYLLDTGIRNMLLKSFEPFQKRTDVGPLLENGVFSSLWKSIDILEELFFWRTIDGKEVDFVLRRGVDYIPFEVKVKRTAINHLKYFNSLYPCKELNLIRLDGENREVPPVRRIPREVSVLPPWLL